MPKFILAFFALFVVLTACSQTPQTLNLGFEEVKNNVPVGWQNFGGDDYSLRADSKVKMTGDYSARIESTGENPNFAAWSLKLPHNYDGKEITLSGYIKTENVEDGYAGLWMRIDPEIAFDNMGRKELRGTSDWKKYEITLEMNPEKTEQIIIGGLLAGKGKVWFDDFTVSVDGKEIEDLEPFHRKVFLAENDHAFDDGSKISEISTDETQIENLKTLGFIWGFLKYYHPNVAKGDFNWDYELFRVLPKVLEAKSIAARDKLLVDWIESLGEFSKGKKPKVKASKVKITPDLAWINQSNFSEELSAKLTLVKNAKRSGKNYYVGLYPGVENPEFKHENAYGKFTYPDAGYRLLSLYRYWNIIQYYFPYKQLIGEDWKGLMAEFIPKFINAENETEYTLSCLELITRVNDTHANIYGGNKVLNAYWGNLNPPVEVTFIENKAVVTDYYDDQLGKDSGLKIGDVIESVNGKRVDKMVAEQLYITPASSHPIKLRNIARRLLNTNDSLIQVDYERNGTTASTTFPSYTAQELNMFGRYDDADTCFKLINDDIAYLNNGTLQNVYIPEIWGKIKNTSGLIIDIRNYPTDFPLYSLSNYLLPNKTPFVSFTNGNITHPGYFIFNENLSVGGKNKEFYKGKVIILTNETSQSSAEFHAMAYRVHPNATVIGSTTAGADGNVSRFYLPGNISTLVTGIGVYYPNGDETQRVGIEPDIECKPTIEGIREGRDELMEKAVQIIESSSNRPVYKW